MMLVKASRTKESQGACGEHGNGALDVNTKVRQGDGLPALHYVVATKQVKDVIFNESKLI